MEQLWCSSASWSDAWGVELSGPLGLQLELQPGAQLGRLKRPLHPGHFGSRGFFRGWSFRGRGLYRGCAAEVRSVRFRFCQIFCGLLTSFEKTEAISASAKVEQTRNRILVSVCRKGKKAPKNQPTAENTCFALKHLGFCADDEHPSGPTLLLLKKELYVTFHLRWSSWLLTKLCLNEFWTHS